MINHLSFSLCLESVGTEVSAEVSADIKGLFSLSVSTSVSTGFDWSQTVTDSATWSSTTSHSMEVILSWHILALVFYHYLTDTIFYISAFVLSEEIMIT